jgi:hypothetical protein
VSVAFALGSKLEQFLALGGVLVLGILVALATRALQKTA